MLEYRNNFYNGVPAKGHSIYVTAFNDHAPSINNLFRMSLGSGYTLNTSKKTIPAFVLDLYDLPNRMPVELRQIDLDGVTTQRATFPFDTTKYHRLWANNLSDDAGSGVFSKLPTFWPFAIDNKLSFEKQVYTISGLAFHPLISENGANQQASAENVIYKSAIIPMFPLMIVSSVSNHFTYGPVFLQNFSINVNGFNSLSEVMINTDFTGGKSFISPPDIPILEPNRAIPKTAQFTGDEPEEILDFRNYRVASLQDCLVSTTIFDAPTTLSAFKKLLFQKAKVSAPTTKTQNQKNMVITAKDNTHKIIGMSLKISQNIEFGFTTPYAEGQYLGDLVGPKYASLRDRTVTGSISIYRAKAADFLDIYPESPLTLYFGNNFLFHFRNVDWGNPQFALAPDKGEIHTWSFTARIPQGAGFWGNTSGGPVSEIDLDHRDILRLS